MKKAIIYSILISLILIGGAYYYFFILQAEPEAPPLPSKVKVVMPKITSIQIAKQMSKEPSKEEKKVEVKKEEPKNIKQKEEKKAETKKVEPKKEEPKKTETKEVVQAKKEEIKKKEEPKKARFYQIVANYSNEEEAINVRNNLISLGYHTAKVVKKGGNSLVVLSPFTDYYEAEYVRKNIEIETKRKEFTTKAVY